MSLHRLKVKAEGPRLYQAEVLLDGKSLEGVKRIETDLDVDGLTEVRITMLVESLDLDVQKLELTREKLQPPASVDGASAVCGNPHPDGDASCTHAAGHRDQHSDGISIWWKPDEDL